MVPLLSNKRGICVSCYEVLITLWFCERSISCFGRYFTFNIFEEDTILLFVLYSYFSTPGKWVEMRK